MYGGQGSNHSAWHVLLRCGGVLWCYSGLAMNRLHPLSLFADGCDGVKRASASRWSCCCCCLFFFFFLVLLHFFSARRLRRDNAGKIELRCSPGWEKDRRRDIWSVERSFDICQECSLWGCRCKGGWRFISIFVDNRGRFLGLCPGCWCRWSAGGGIEARD